MFVLYRSRYYKICLCLGIVICTMSCTLLYLSVVYNIALFYGIIIVSYSMAYTLFYLIKYLKKDMNYLVLRIDRLGMFLCTKKHEGVFVPWKDIKYVIFLVANSGSKIVIRQHDKKTHYLLLTHYYHCFRPNRAIKAAYRYTYDKNKIREVKDWLLSTYEDIMRNISNTEVKHK